MNVWKFPAGSGPSVPSPPNRQVKAAYVIRGASREAGETGWGSWARADCALLESTLRALAHLGGSPAPALPLRGHARGSRAVSG